MSWTSMKAKIGTTLAWTKHGRLTGQDEASKRLHPEYGTPGLGVWNAGQKPKRPCFTVKRWFHVKVNVGVFQTSLDHFP
uniref:Uncharacterized protein n=1 Tax=Helianthus annuus TaxID=4232 RepID=A0A251UNS0_HELAN